MFTYIPIDVLLFHLAGFSESAQYGSYMTLFYLGAFIQWKLKFYYYKIIYKWKRGCKMIEVSVIVICFLDIKLRKLMTFPHGIGLLYVYKAKDICAPTLFTELGAQQ